MEQLLIFGLLIGVGISLLVGIAAERKGHSFLGFFLLTLLFFPLGLLAVLLVRPTQDKVAPHSSLIKCEFCAELINREAKICKHCGKDVPISSQIPNQANDIQKTTDDESHISASTLTEESRISESTLTVPLPPTYKYTNIDGSEVKTLIRVLTGITFGFGASFFASSVIGLTFFHGSRPSDLVWCLILVLDIAITWYAIFKRKIITWMLNINVLIYSIVGAFLIYLSSSLSLIAATFIAIAFLSLYFRLHLKKVKVSWSAKLDYV